MINRFSIKQSYSNNNTTSNIFHFNPLRIKRTYNSMLEQSNSIPNIANFASKRLKQSDGKPPESIKRPCRPKIPEKLLKEIENYNHQRFAYNRKIIACPCPV